MFTRHSICTVVAAWLLVTVTAAPLFAADDSLVLNLRQQQKATGAEGKWQVVEQPTAWEPKKTAVIVCDMWDKHWCENSTRRVGEMAPRMNEVVSLARSRGMFIIHCPSDTLDFYKDTPQRKLAQNAPVVEPKVPLQRWNRLDPSKEPPLPIDDSDGGCDDVPQPKSQKAWSRQHAALEIKEGDAITDSAEAYYLLRQRGIENVIVMGVHTNMCVLGRPFSIRQLVHQGLNVALMRDMTDTMYNPAKAPQVPHVRGTDLVVEHIERYWCPTLTSSDLTGQPAFKFSDDKRPHVVFLVGEDEYKTKDTLPQFANDELEPRGLRCTFVHSDPKQLNHFPLIKAVETADLLVISVRRRTPPKEELDVIRKYCAAGKPLVGIRTASHAFAPHAKDAANPLGDTWSNFDEEILGGKYTGHYGKPKEGPNALVWSAASDHPITANLPAGEIASSSWLYKYGELPAGSKLLMLGRVAGQPEKEPVAWVNTKRNKVFYTMLGDVNDFQQPYFKELLRRSVFWGLEGK